MKKTKWIMALDDFDDGKGEQNYPHCPECGRGVYKHDAGIFCPFCGTYMLMEEELYPLTIIRDRYNGVYSGASWLAFNLDYNEIPDAVCGSDIDCLNFWQNEGKDMVVGKGAYPQEALNDLYWKVWKVMKDD